MPKKKAAISIEEYHGTRYITSLTQLFYWLDREALVAFYYDGGEGYINKTGSATVAVRLQVRECGACQAYFLTSTYDNVRDIFVIFTTDNTSSWYAIPGATLQLAAMTPLQEKRQRIGLTIIALRDWWRKLFPKGGLSRSEYLLTQAKRLSKEKNDDKQQA